VEVAETSDFLRTITPEKLFDLATWTKLPAFARVIPPGDILPMRITLDAEYGIHPAPLQEGHPARGKVV
jgi:hypothetical protein